MSASDKKNKPNHSKPSYRSQKNQSFSESALARCFYPVDFHNDQNLSDNTYFKKVLSDAYYEANNLLKDGADLSEIIVKKRKTFYNNSFAKKIVLRRCAENIKIHCAIRNNNRNALCREINCFLINETKYNIYKLDVKSFFENVSFNLIEKTLLQYDKLSIQNKEIIKNVIRKVGFLPRGIEISPIMGEVVLNGFDEKIKKHPEVIYFSRFVDDVLIITTADENEIDFIEYLKCNLPEGLSFNASSDKQKIIKVKDFDKEEKYYCFDYLGYEFFILKCNVERRKIRVDISIKKINTIKTKIIRALVFYSKNGDFDLLLDRIKFLTSNRQINDKNTGKKVPAGIYYNYSMLSSESKSLEELDNSLYHFLYNYDVFFKKGNGKALSKKEIMTLLKYSFRYGFENKKFVRFSLNRISEMTRIWK